MNACIMLKVLATSRTKPFVFLSESLLTSRWNMNVIFFKKVEQLGYIYMYLCIYVHTCAHTHARTRTHTTHTHAHAHAHTTHTHTHNTQHTHTQHTHTHTHTHNRPHKLINLLPVLLKYIIWIYIISMIFWKIMILC